MLADEKCAESANKNLLREAECDFTRLPRSGRPSDDELRNKIETDGKRVMHRPDVVLRV